MQYSEVSSCRVCGGSLREGFSLGNLTATGIFPRTTDPLPTGPVDVVQCNDCGLTQLKQTYDLAAMYGDGYGYRSGLNGSMVKHLGELKRIADFYTPNGNRILDIGSNDGTLLNMYDKQRLRVGVDPTIEKFAKYYKEGITKVPLRFEDTIVQKEDKFDVVYSVACFYDIPDPVVFAKKVELVLEDGGVWLLEVAYLPTQLANNAFDGFCQEHLEYYRLVDIHNILQKTNMHILDFGFNNVNGGSLWVVAGRGSRGLFGQTVMKVLEVEEECLGKNYLQHFESRLGNTIAEVFNTISEHSAGNLYAFGASTKGNVLLQTLDLRLIKAIVEVNEDKFGCFTPGTNIPIISEADAKDVGAYLVLPWHFRDSILDRYKGSGIKFIFPLPYPEVVVA